MTVKQGRVLFTACQGGAMLGGGSIVILALRDQGIVDVPVGFAAGSLWGMLVGSAAWLFADKYGETRGRPVHPLKAAAGAAGFTAATSWLPFFICLGMMSAGC